MRSGTTAGRPQPQTTTEVAGGPFIRHAPDGRRAQYVDTQQYGGFMSRPTVSMPGYAKGCRVCSPGPAAPTRLSQRTHHFRGCAVELHAASPDERCVRDSAALVSPGYVIRFEVPLYSGQFGTTDCMRSPVNSPQQTVYNTTLSSVWGLYRGSSPPISPFEFLRKRTVSFPALALALLQLLQSNLAAATALYCNGRTALRLRR